MDNCRQNSEPEIPSHFRPARKKDLPRVEDTEEMCTCVWWGGYCWFRLFSVSCIISCFFVYQQVATTSKLHRDRDLGCMPINHGDIKL